LLALRSGVAWNVGKSRSVWTVSVCMTSPGNVTPSNAAVGPAGAAALADAVAEEDCMADSSSRELGPECSRWSDVRFLARLMSGVTRPSDRIAVVAITVGLDDVDEAEEDSSARYCWWALALGESRLMNGTGGMGRRGDASALLKDDLTGEDDKRDVEALWSIEAEE